MIGGVAAMDPLCAPVYPTTISATMSNKDAAKVILALAQHYKRSIPFGDNTIREAVARAVALLQSN